MTQIAAVNWCSFEQFSPFTLYRVLRLREQVFMLEQNSLYEELDNQDQLSLHGLCWQGENLVGYLRLLPLDGDGQMKMGRIVLEPSARGGKLGGILILAGLEHAKQAGAKQIKISAQLGLKDYYQGFGFKAVSEPYDDGGVDHLDMICDLTK